MKQLDRQPASAVSSQVQPIDRLGRFDLAALILVPLYLGLVATPWIPQQIPFASLDGGYQASLNAFALDGLPVGEQLITTTGPLGYLRNQVNWPETNWHRIGWALYLSLLFSSLTWLRGRQTLSLAVRVGAITSFILLLGIIGTAFWRVLPALSLSALVLYASEYRAGLRPWHLLFLPALSISAWILFTDLLAVTIVLVAFAALDWIRTRRVGRVPIALASMILFVWIISGQSVLSLPDYIRSSMALALSYPEVMSRDGDSLTLVVSLGLTALWFLTLGLGTSSWEPLRRLVFLGAALAILFLSFKAAFVRFHPARVQSFMAILALPLLPAMRISCTRFFRGSAVACISLCTATSLLLPALLERDLDLAGQPISRTISAPLGAARALLAFAGQPDLNQRRFRRNVREIQSSYPFASLPPHVTLFGDRQGLLLAQGHTPPMPPVFQRFSSFTPYLMGLNRAYFRDTATAPELLLFDFKYFDRFHPGLLDGQALLEILQHYELLDTLLVDDRPPSFALLRRNARESSDLRFGCLEDRVETLGETVELPGGGSNAIAVKFTVERTLLGRLAGIALRSYPLEIELSLADGSSRSYLVSPTAARAGFLLSPLILDAHDLGTLLRKGASRPRERRQVVAFSLKEPRAQRRGHYVARYKMASLCLPNT